MAIINNRKKIQSEIPNEKSRSGWDLIWGNKDKGDKEYVEDNREVDKADKGQYQEVEASDKGSLDGEI